MIEYLLIYPSELLCFIVITISILEIKGVVR